jgi:hypothetical protein
MKKTKCPCGRESATTGAAAVAHQCKDCYDIYQWASVHVHAHRTEHELEATQAEIHFIPVVELQTDSGE